MTTPPVLLDPTAELDHCLAFLPQGVRCRGVLKDSLRVLAPPPATGTEDITLVGLDGDLLTAGAPLFSSALQPRHLSLHLPDGAVLQPGTASSRRTADGVRCSSSDVSVRPACVSEPTRSHEVQATARPSTRSCSTALFRVGTLPPWPLTKMVPEAHRQADRANSTSRHRKASCPIEIVPGNPSCSPLAP